MTKTVRKFFGFGGNISVRSDDDFSKFFHKDARSRVKVMRRVLDAANAEQKETVERYKKI